MIEGLTLRDWFAASISAEEIEATIRHSISPLAAEVLVGAKKPELDKSKFEAEAVLDYQLATLVWNCRVRAAARYAMADAMLKERKRV